MTLAWSMSASPKAPLPAPGHHPPEPPPHPEPPHPSSSTAGHDGGYDIKPALRLRHSPSASRARCGQRGKTALQPSIPLHAPFTADPLEHPRRSLARAAQESALRMRVADEPITRLGARSLGLRTVHGVVRARDSDKTLRLARSFVGIESLLRRGHGVIERDDHKTWGRRDSLDEGGRLVFVIELPGPHGHFVAPVPALLGRPSRLIAHGLAVVGKACINVGASPRRLRPPRYERDSRESPL